MDNIWNGAPEVLINLSVNSNAAAMIIRSLWLSVSVCGSVQSVMETKKKKNMFVWIRGVVLYQYGCVKLYRKSKMHLLLEKKGLSRVYWIVTEFFIEPEG